MEEETSGEIKDGAAGRGEMRGKKRNLEKLERGGKGGGEDRREM